MYKQITIVGNVGSEPEMRFTPNGNAVTSFSVAVNEKRTKDGETQEETTWFRVTTWNKLAEVCFQYLSKGRQVLVVGSPRLRQWDASDGTTKTALEINAREVKFLGKAKEQTQDIKEESELEDIPF